jgi:hypothetical protein
MRTIPRYTWETDSAQQDAQAAEEDDEAREDEERAEGALCA